ncbi:hypothetical protein AUR64_12690 [Haloprofundus marisrubri]|uniref:Uncharacterized protein n=1 Tax=Haloprofundus marisrubri TaxID=1514971 RepID=A0A0W1RBD2_9EURY|nr:hypothetical protein [Haloprofundus marisrubri]KTG10415.1 hypothetical protein AUR64_12690 [Haloprofundus marisrubri]
MSKQNKFSRRKVVSAIGAIGAVGVGAGFANTAAAHGVEPTFTAHDPDVLVNDDGSVRKVNVGVSHGAISWKGLDSPAKEAMVFFCAVKDGKQVTLDSKVLSATGLRGTNSFSFDPVDLTEKPFDDAHFESDEDGKLTETDVKLKLRARVDTQAGNKVTGDTYDTMTVGVQNIEGQTKATGKANASVGSYHQKYAGMYQNKEGISQPIEGGMLNLYVTYGKQTVTYVAEYDEPEGYEYSMADADFGTNNNLTLGIDGDDDGCADFQLTWFPGSADTNEDGFAYKATTDEPKWDAWGALPDGFSASKEGNLVTFEVPRKALGEDDSYKVGAQASAGGEAPSVVVSGEEGKLWSSEKNWTSSQYFIESKVRAGYSNLYVSDNDEICVGVVHDDSDDDDHDDDTNTTTFDVVAPNGFDGDHAPDGYSNTHVELFFDFDNDGDWDTQVRRGVGNGVVDTGAGVFYQNNGGSWMSNFDGISVEETDDGFVVTVDDDLLGDSYGVGAYGTRVTAVSKKSEMLGTVTKSGSGRPWNSGNLIETSQ